MAEVCARHGKGLIVDAMSSFGALPIDAREIRFDALVAASGKCLEGVPGMGFVFMRKAILEGCAGHSQSLAMDLHDQHAYMEKTGQWRFTPPTHVVVALAEAIAQFEEEGGQPRAPGPLHAELPDADRRHVAPGLHALPRPGDPGADHRHLPCAGRRALRLQDASMPPRAQRGFILYPGKLTQVETFRVGCIGAIGRNEMEQAVHAVALALEDMGIASGRAGDLGA